MTRPSRRGPPSPMRSACPARASAHHVIATGHAHIDTAWLWPIGETVRKCTRTFASAVALMDAEPRPPLLVLAGPAVRVDRGTRARAVRPHHRQGRRRSVDPGRRDVGRARHEPAVGRVRSCARSCSGSASSSSSSACAAARCGSPTCSATRPGCRRSSRPAGWTASSPRSCRGTARTASRTRRSGGRASTAPGCSPTSRPSTPTTPRSCPSELAHSVRRFAEHAWSGWSLMPFGYGDGGGGPTREMLERQRRMADLDGMPTVELGSPGDFFDRVDAEVAAGAPVPVWRGELYFETHRGTLTSQLRTKLGNKRCERLLREAELWTATAGGAPGALRRAVAGGADAAVPRHHPGLVDRLGPRRGGGGPPPHRRRARRAHRRPAPRARAGGTRRSRTWRPGRATRSSSPTSSRSATGRSSASPTVASPSARRRLGLGIAPAVRRRRRSTASS